MPDPLYVGPGAGHRAAALCEAAAGELAVCATELETESSGERTWLGDCEEGRGWHRLLEEQTASLHRLLEQHAQNLSGFAARLRGADAAYHDADRGGAHRYSP
jgi:hypothetical protein